MVNNILICTHGEAGKELINSVEMIMGPQTNVFAIPFYSDESADDIIRKYEEIVKDSLSSNFLILTDIFGGSPFNAAVSLVLNKEDEENIEVVTGVNIPMLLEVFSLGKEASLEEVAETALKSGVKGVERLDLSKLRS